MKTHILLAVAAIAVLPNFVEAQHPLTVVNHYKQPVEVLLRAGGGEWQSIRVPAKGTTDSAIMHCRHDVILRLFSEEKAPTETDQNRKHYYCEEFRDYSWEIAGTFTVIPYGQRTFPVDMQLYRKCYHDPRVGGWVLFDPAKHPFEEEEVEDYEPPKTNWMRVMYGPHLIAPTYRKGIERVHFVVAPQRGATLIIGTEDKEDKKAPGEFNIPRMDAPSLYAPQEPMPPTIVPPVTSPPEEEIIPEPAPEVLPEELPQNDVPEALPAN